MVSSYSYLKYVFNDTGAEVYARAFIDKNKPGANTPNVCQEALVSTKYIKETLKPTGTKDHEMARDLPDLFIKAGCLLKKIDPPGENVTTLYEIRDVLDTVFAAYVQGTDAKQGSELELSDTDTLSNELNDDLKKYYKGIKRSLASRFERLTFYCLAFLVNNTTKEAFSRVKSICLEEMSKLYRAEIVSRNNINAQYKEDIVNMITQKESLTRTPNDLNILEALTEIVFRTIVDKMVDGDPQTYEEAYDIALRRDVNFYSLVSQIIDRIKPDFYKLVGHTKKYISECTYQNDLYENVYAKWDTIDECSKVFFRWIIDILDVNNKVVPENEYMRVAANKKNYRLNLRKTMIGGYYPSFISMIYEPETNFTGFWYTNKLLQQKLINYYDATVLKVLFMASYTGKTVKYDGQVIDTITNNDVPATMCSFDINKLMKDLINRCKIYYKVFSDNDRPMTDTIINRLYFDFPYGNIWQRDHLGNLVRIVKGEIVRYDESPVTNDDDNSCFGTYMYGVSQKELQELDSEELEERRRFYKSACKKVFSCLENGDVEGVERCEANWEADVGFEVGIKEISNVKPQTAIKVLDTFGFRKFKAAHPKFGNNPLFQYESVDSWMRGVVNNRFTNDKVKDALTGGNSRVLKYLALLVSHVNSNPSMLNKDFKRKQGMPDANTKDGPYYPNAQVMKFDNETELENARQALHMIKTMKSTFYGATGASNPLYVTNNGLYIHPYQSKYSDFSKTFPMDFYGGGGSRPVIEDVIVSVIESLRKKQKTISKNELDKIKHDLDNLEKYDVSLRNTLITLEEYDKLMTIFGNTTSDSNLTLKKLKGLNDFYGSQLEKRFKLEKSLRDKLEGLYTRLIDTIKPKEMSTSTNSTRLRSIHDITRVYGKSVGHKDKQKIVNEENKRHERERENITMADIRQENDSMVKRLLQKRRGNQEKEGFSVSDSLTDSLRSAKENMDKAFSAPISLTSTDEIFREQIKKVPQPDMDKLRHGLASTDQMFKEQIKKPQQSDMDRQRDRRDRLDRLASSVEVFKEQIKKPDMDRPRDGLEEVKKDNDLIDFSTDSPDNAFAETKSLFSDTLTNVTPLTDLIQVLNKVNDSNSSIAGDESNNAKSTTQTNKSMTSNLSNERSIKSEANLVQVLNKVNDSNSSNKSMSTVLGDRTGDKSLSTILGDTNSNKTMTTILDDTNSNASLGTIPQDKNTLTDTNSNVFPSSDFLGSMSNHGVDRILTEKDLVSTSDSNKILTQKDLSMSDSNKILTEKDLVSTSDPNKILTQKDLVSTSDPNKILTQKDLVSTSDPNKILTQKDLVSTSDSNKILTEKDLSMSDSNKILTEKDLVSETESNKGLEDNDFVYEPLSEISSLSDTKSPPIRPSAFRTENPDKPRNDGIVKPFIDTITSVFSGDEYY